MDQPKDKYNVPIGDPVEIGRPDGLDVMNVVSGTECTGMIPTPPLDDGETGAYREIYDVPVERSDVNTPHSDRKQSGKYRA